MKTRERRDEDEEPAGERGTARRKKKTTGIVNKGRHVTSKYFSILITLIKNTDYF